jgi:hypothetical protein
MVNWKDVNEKAREIIAAYPPASVTLRQLFYRLVAAQILPNTKQAYKGLSRTNAQLRRDDDFPKLLDATREIRKPLQFDSVGEAAEYITSHYRRDKDAAQEYHIILGIEKDALVGLLWCEFVRYGVGVVSLHGYSSQTLDADFLDELTDDRELVLIYGGDLDPSGYDILRNLEDQTDNSMIVERVALTLEQVDAYDLPENYAKATDSRKDAFVRDIGRDIQVELDALPPEELMRLYHAKFEEYYDMAIYTKLVEQENGEREIIRNALKNVDKS